MKICLEFHPQAIYQSQASKRLNKGRAYFQEAIPELLDKGLLVCQNGRYYTVPANIVRKLSGGVRNHLKNPSQPLSLDNQFLTYSESYGQHAYISTFFHDYPEHLWKKLRGFGYWIAEDHSNIKRFVVDPMYSSFEEEQYRVEIYKKKMKVYGPAVSEKEANNRGYRYNAGSQAGRFINWFVNKRLAKGKLQVRVKEEKIRFHETNRTYLFQGISNKLFDTGYNKIVRQHYMHDSSKGINELEFNEGYNQAGGVGFGPDLVDDVLFFPGMYMNTVYPQQQQQLATIQTNLELIKERDKQRDLKDNLRDNEVLKALQLLNNNMENVSVHLDNLATKEDIEILNEAVQKLSLRQEKLSERRVYVNLDSKCQKILKELSGGALTRSELALLLGVSDAAPLTQIRKLLAAELIEEVTINKGKVGRPKIKYKIKEMKENV